MAAPRIDNLNSYQNLMINGNFDFWQRNTTFTAVANNAYTADRWQHGKAGSMVATISRNTDVPTTAQSGFASQYSLLYTVTAAQGSLNAGDFASIGYKVEGQDYAGIAGGQATRIQFWVKSSVTGTYSAALRNNAANRSYVTTVTVSAANTWERKTIDLTTDSAGTWLLDNGVGLILTISLGTGTTFQTNTLNAWQAGNFLAASSQTNLQATNGATFQLAQVMLVKGSFPSASTSLTFQRAGRTIQQELAMCQRYFEKSFEVSTAPGASYGCPVQPFYITNLTSATRLTAITQLYTVEKRAAATAANIGMWANTSVGGYGITTNGRANGAFGVETPNTLYSSTTKGFNFRVDDSGPSTVQVIHYHYAVDTEL